MPSSLIDDLVRQRGDLPVPEFTVIEPALPILFAVLAQVKDTRRRRGRRHAMGTILAIVLVAVLCGTRGGRGVGRFARGLSQEHLVLLGARRDRFGRSHAPSATTLRDALDEVDPDALDDAFGLFLQRLQREWAGDGLVGYSVDGKTVRGARDAHGGTPHLVAALRQDSGTVVAQRQVPAKSSEHAAFRPVVTALGQGDPAGAVILADALHTTRAVAAWLHEQRAHYVFCIKENQPTLFNTVNDLPWDEDEWAHTETARTKGRTETRSINVLPAPQGCFPHAAQVFLIHRVTHGPGLGRGRDICHLGITDLTAHQADPARLAAFVRAEWGIEVVHNIRDVTYREDASRVRAGHRPRIMASFRNMAISLARLSGWTSIPQAHEYYRDNKHDALALLGLT